MSNRPANIALRTFSEMVEAGHLMVEQQVANAHPAGQPLHASPALFGRVVRALFRSEGNRNPGPGLIHPLVAALEDRWAQHCDEVS